MLFDRTIDVLLVEDNPGDSRLIQINLSEQHEVRFRVRVCEDLASACACLASARFDVVLLDLFLPDSQGLRTLERLMVATNEIPVVVMSGLDDFTTAMQAVQQGAQDYLVKGKGDGELVRRAILHAIERQRFRRQLLMAEAAFRHTDTGMMVTDAHGVVVRVNPAFLDVTGYGADEVVGRMAPFLRSDVHDGDFYRDIWKRLGETSTWEGEIWTRRRNGEIAPDWLRINGVTDPSGGVVGYVVVFSDITFRRRAEEELVRQATTDPLTGLPNRALFQKLLVSGLERARRYDRHLGLLFVDIDGFKQVNDRFGHEGGDEVLREVARRLRRAVRVSDEVARLGGDEFTLLLSEVKAESDVETVAAKVVQVLGEAFSIEDQPLVLSASVGVALSPADGRDAESLLRAADEAMYRAKRGGKNRYALASAAPGQTPPPR
ncbi:diguanylate cyclase domain-containing protein [Rhodospirillum rubrum]|uniref:Guanylate cyclase (GGDEF domain) with PAS/PAC sensor and Response Regulator Receiver modulation n=2 Tax=Rhodospirillum rubrum TaxID=1085 RepID=Q2RTU2_RHORT|nr:diguanylate cyclase [Rhodospirillum rubrum]ABC22453.1 guanylate cyclase (GGDEF domain) with PAS/PAC sensor and Response Regulator Receiver modulation [Rhodospirillum rubrum ATCC 11170]AEO48170.1 guanylate cyclase [Rhodospirillum rubrum F11]MBK5954035.1 guanylate cyclase [Rhodospirillum rubrum]QXG82085.1 diguanylate cyclase [Rhodospirillum rubrum]